MKRDRNRFGLVDTLRTRHQIRITTAVGLLALAFASSTQADELVVATGDIVAGKELTYYAGSPAINDTGDLAFTGGWTNGSGGYDFGAFLLAADGTEALLAATGDVVAGKNLIYAVPEAINDAGDVVFSGRWWNDSGGSERGVLLLAADGTESLLAAPGDIVAGKELIDASFPAINDAGDVLFEGAWRDDSGRYQDGVFLLGADGTEALLAARGDIVADKELADVSFPAINDAGDLVFSGGWWNDSGGAEYGVFLLGADGTEALLIATGDIVAGKELIYASSPAINDAADLVFSGRWWNDAGQLEYGVLLLAADGTEALLAAPGDIVAGKELTGADYPGINDAGDVVFEAYWTSNAGEASGAFLLPNAGTADLLDLLEQLILDVDAINARNGVKNSLDSKLDNALDSLEAINADQRQDAVNKMEAFINSVEAQRGENIGDEEADFLIDSALEIIRLIGA